MSRVCKSRVICVPSDFCADLLHILMWFASLRFSVKSEGNYSVFTIWNYSVKEINLVHRLMSVYYEGVL